MFPVRSCRYIVRTGLNQDLLRMLQSRHERSIGSRGLHGRSIDIVIQGFHG